MKNNYYGNNKIISKEIIVPSNIYKAVNELNLSRIQTNKAFEFISHLIEYAQREEGNLFSFLSYSSALFIKIFNSKYGTFLKPLLEAQIVLCDNRYSKDGGKSLHYRINPKIVKQSEKIAIAKVSHRNSNTNTSQNDKYYKGFMDFYNQLEIPFDKLYGAVDSIISDITIKHYEVNEKIPNGNYEIVFNDGFKAYYSKKVAIRIAMEDDLEVIKDGKRLYIDSKDNFLLNKRLQTKIAYLQSIKNLETKNIYVRRNETNFRLDHNFTNFPKKLLNYIIKHNDLAEIDAVNSQYAILANVLGKGIDPLFYKNATEGKLYEGIQEKLDCTREDAKLIMMQVVYSKLNSKHIAKNSIMEVYPKMMESAKELKKVDHKALPIKMQQIESDIFVSSSLSKLYKDNISAITKHDSIICFNKDKNHARQTLLQVLQERDFKLTLNT